MALDLTLSTSATKMSGGLAAVAGVGQRYQLTVGGAWVVGDKWTLLFTDSTSGLQVQAGAGYITGLSPVFCFTFNNKVYLLAGATVYFSGVGLPTHFNDPAASGLLNGYVGLTNHYGTPEDLVSMAAFQGRVVFFSRQTAQIWTCPADPASWQLNQIFDFIGSRSPLSVKSTGDLDVLFLDETGVRSLRVRDSTLNAYPEDLGSPIDDLVQALLIASSENQKNAALGIVEPASKRYWLFLNNVIYVFSNFPSGKIVAWAKYSPTYQSGSVQTSFAPVKIVTFKGRVYIQGADNALYLYGGTNNNTYDNCVATAELPWLDGKTPATRKLAKGIDISISGAWALSAGMDPESGTLGQIFSGSTPSFDKGKIPYSDQGTHFKLKAITTGSTAAKLASLVFKYELGDEE